MNNSSRFPQLMGADIIRDLPDDQKAALLDSCAVRIFQEKASFIRQGELAAGMFLVAHGSVEVGYTSSDGYHAILYHAGLGKALGMMEAIAGQPCAATCTAFPNTTVLLCPTPLLFEQVKSPVFIRNLASVACDMMNRDNASKTIDKFYTAEQRICSYLSQLTEDGASINQSQTYLAQVVGCSRQTINKELGFLKEHAIVALSKGSVSVLDHDALQRRIADLDAAQFASRN